VPKTTTNATERRTDIIAATIRVLAREGIAETTTRKIAAEAEVNQATLRYYFGSKDDLLFAVLQEMMRTTREVVQAAITSTGELHDTIAESIKAFWMHVETTPEFQVMQYELTLYALRHPASAWLAKQQYDGYSALVETLFQQKFAAAGKNCAIPFAELARFVIASLDGLILQFISDRDPIRSRHDLDHLIFTVIALSERNPTT
jgi:AcrR family transcriptional regulator